MTKNELFTLIANAESDSLTAVFGDAAAEMQELANHALDVDAAAKERAKEKRASGEKKETSAHAANRQKFHEWLLPVLTAEPQTTAQLAEKLGVKATAVTPVAKVGVELGLCVASDMKVPGKGTAKAYAIA